MGDAEWDMLRASVSEMTYNVLTGMLNSTIPYHTFSYTQDSNQTNPNPNRNSHMYTVFQKNPCDYVFDDNLNSKRPIVIIFGTVIT